MRIALIGGTGDIGEALALRFGRDTDHDLVIGSRTESKAIEQAAQYRDELTVRSHDCNLIGAANDSAVIDADVAVLTVPPYYIEDTVESLAPNLSANTILVSPAVGMQRNDDGLHYHPPRTGSIAELVATTAPVGTPVICAFTNLSAKRFSDLDEDVEQDTIVVGDNSDAKETVCSLASELQGVRAVDAGPLANAAEVECLTPLLINIARYTGEVSDAGVKFV